MFILVGASLVCLYLLWKSFKHPEAAVVLLACISTLKYSAFWQIPFFRQFELLYPLAAWAAILVVIYSFSRKAIPGSVHTGAISVIIAMGALFWLRTVGIEDASVKKSTAFMLCIFLYICPIVLLRDSKASYRMLCYFAVIGFMLAIFQAFFGTTEIMPGKTNIRQGLFGTSGIYLGLYVGGGLLALFGLTIIKRTKRFWVLLMISFAISLLAIIATGTRGPIIWAFAFPALFMAGVFGSREMWKYLIIIGLLIGVVYLIMPFMYGFGAERIGSMLEGKGGLSGRDVIWAQAFDDWLNNPMLGIGTGRFTVGGEPIDLTNRDYAHNILLEAASELGIFGFIFLSIIVFSSFIAATKQIFRKGTHPVMKSHMQAWLLVAAGLFLSAMKSGGITGSRFLFLALGILAVLTKMSASMPDVSLSGDSVMFEDEYSLDSSAV